MNKNFDEDRVTEDKQNCQEFIQNQDAVLFKESFKTYRSWKKRYGEKTENSPADPTMIRDLVDLNEESQIKALKKFQISAEDVSVCPCGSKFFGLRPTSTWKIYKFDFPAGLIFIRNPFTSEGQRYWVAKSLSDYPKKPYVTNIDNLNRISGEGKSEPMVCGKTDADFYKKLRWVTFGYHHDWDTKVYSDDYKCEFPSDLGALTKFISKALGFDDFKAEAAIVNYYHLDSTLSGHVDRSEVNQEAPLFSLSFGQTAIFLIGGRSKNVKPLALSLHSGDIAVMTGESRFSYHGVPCILPTSNHPWISESHENESVCEVIDSQTTPKKLKMDDTVSKEDSSDSKCSVQDSFILHRSNPLIRQVLDKWSNFHIDYVSKSRINLNVRQVLFPGQNSLCSEKFEKESG